MGDPGKQLFLREFLAGSRARCNPLQQRRLQRCFRSDLRQITDEKWRFETQEGVQLTQQLFGERGSRSFAHAAGSIPAGTLPAGRFERAHPPPLSACAAGESSSPPADERPDRYRHDGP